MKSKKIKPLRLLFRGIVIFFAVIGALYAVVFVSFEIDAALNHNTNVARSVIARLKQDRDFHAPIYFDLHNLNNEFQIIDYKTEPTFVGSDGWYFVQFKFNRPAALKNTSFDPARFSQKPLNKEFTGFLARVKKDCKKCESVIDSQLLRYGQKDDCGLLVFYYDPSSQVYSLFYWFGNNCNSYRRS